MNPYTQQLAIYFDTLRRVLEMDPHRLSGVVEYATNPDNAEDIVIDIPSSAHHLLIEAATYGKMITAGDKSDAVTGLKTKGHAAINKAEKLTAEELQQNGFSYKPLALKLG